MYTFDTTETTSGGTMKNYRVLATILSICALCSTVWSQGLPSAAPEDAGISGARLTRIDDFVERHLEANHLAGAVTLVARRGKIVQFEAYGLQDIEADTPMSTDSIFRIYSMSKPITSVAVMILFEEGRFLLKDPVSRWLPEFKDIEVGVEEVDEETGEKVLKTVPADREVTIRDLLRHTSGLTYGFWGSSLVDKMYLEKKVLTEDATIQETVSKLGTIPLKHQPGTVWEYGLSTDVLGRLVEVVSGQPFDDFLQEHVFDPLRMTDTGFSVPPEHVQRLAIVYEPNDSNTAIAPYDPDKMRDYLKKPSYFSGGGGLVSTATDYFRFSQMLLNGGELEGVRILGSETVELMTGDHLLEIDDRRDLGPYSFGLGFGIVLERGISGSILSEGTYGWGGLAHTAFWIDPEEELIGVFLTQILPESPLPYRDLFRPVVYQAIVD
jgi:CubicO group peptidase (beta-lactamase class C family)